MPENLHALWLETVRQDPTAPAVTESASGRQWSRAELNQAAEDWLGALPASAPLARRRVALAEPNGAAWLAIFIGLLKADAVAVPLDPAEPEEAHLATARAVQATFLWKNAALHPLAVHRAEARPDVCVVKLTSGSTGAPRPLLFTHTQLAADSRQICSSMDIRPDDLNLGIIPFGHSYGLGNLILPLLLQGTPLIAAASPLPNALASDCARWKPTLFPAVPTLLRAMTLTDIEPSAIASLRTVISAGAPLSAEIAAAFASRFELRVHSFYGSSETGGITYDRTGEATALGRSVGTPLDGVRLVFRKSGRFEVISPAVMGPGRHVPPDKARLNELNELVLLGRTGRIAKIAGRRVDLGEIEKLLCTAPGIEEAAVMLHPCRADALAAVVAGKVDPASLRQTLRDHMALWKIPERLLVVTELPRTGRGKVDRKKIQRTLAG